MELEELLVTFKMLDISYYYTYNFKYSNKNILVDLNNNFVSRPELYEFIIKLLLANNFKFSFTKYDDLCIFSKKED
jgi:hypothetical protein